MNNSNIPLSHIKQSQIVIQKILSVHSVDRDINKWPNSSEFEITLPEKMNNIQSMRLVSISLPVNQYIFSNENQNTKLPFSVTFDTSGTSLDGNTNTFVATIDEGTYNTKRLVNELTFKMNEIVAKVPDTGTDISYNFFEHKYNENTNKIMFGNKRDNFAILASQQTFEADYGENMTYDNLSFNQTIVKNNYSHWGLPFYLGFEKKDISANPVKNSYKYNNEKWLTCVGDSSNVYVINPSNNLDIHGDHAIYMEIEKFNSMTELTPYSSNTNNRYNNDYNGKINSAFAKIPLIHSDFGQLFDSRNGFLNNYTIFNPPVNSIHKLKFKFRYHDGRLVDFKNLSFGFSIEFNQLKDEQMAILRKRNEADYAIASNKTMSW